MAYRRIYDTNIKKFLIASGITIPLIFGIFYYLAVMKDITITGYSEDIICAGTLEDPCYAFINFTANKDIYIYPTNETAWSFNTSKQMKEIIMQRSWGKSWRTIDLSKPWSTKVKYAIKFSAGQNYSLRFIGYKTNAFDDVKWSFGDIDPVWKGVAEIELLENTQECLIDCYLKFRIKLIKGDYYISDNSKFNMVFKKDIQALDLSDWGWKMGQNLSHNETFWVPNLECHNYDITYPNGTIIEIPNCTDKGHLETVEKWEIKYHAFNPIGKTMKNDTWYYVELWGKKRPQLNNNNIDAVPILFGYELPFAWWNTTWKAKTSISVTSNSTITNPNAAIQFWFNTSGSTAIKDCTNELRFLNAAESIDLTSTNLWVRRDLAPNCDVVIKWNVSASASNEKIGYIYYNNTLASAPADSRDWVYEDFDNNTRIDDAVWNTSVEWRFDGCVAATTNINGSIIGNTLKLNGTGGGAGTPNNAKGWVTIKKFPIETGWYATFKALNYSSTNEAQLRQWGRGWGLYRDVDANALIINLKNYNDVVSEYNKGRVLSNACNYTVFQSTPWYAGFNYSLRNVNYTWNIVSTNMSASYHDGLATANATVSNLTGSYGLVLFGTTREPDTNIITYFDDICINCKIYRNQSITIGTEKRYTNTTILYLNDSSINRFYEYSTGIGIEAEINDTICLSIDAKGYGDNYTCSAGGKVTVNLPAFANQFKFNDSATWKNLTANTTVYIQFHNKSIDLNGAEWNLTGYNTSNYYPQNIKIDIGNDGIIDKNLVGELRGNLMNLDNLNDSSIAKNITFIISESKVEYINLPRRSNITYATMNISGFESTYTIENDTEVASSCSGDFRPEYPCSNAFNENWNDWASADYSDTVYIYENFTPANVPISALNWTAKFYFYPGGAVSSYCWNYSSSDWSLVADYTLYLGKTTTKTYSIPINCNSTIISLRTTMTSSPTVISSYYEGKLISISISNATNPYINIGNDLDIEWNYTGKFNHSVSPKNISNFQKELDDYLWSSSCIDLVCDVPITMHSDTGAKLQISDINITYNPNPISLNNTKIQEYISTTLKVPFNITSEILGTLQINDLNFSYYGSQNISISAYQSRNSSNSDNHSAYVVYSKINVTLPLGIDYWEIFPTNLTQYNITPYGQDLTTAIWNITSLAYDRPLNVSIRLNTSFSCINIIGDKDNTKDDGIIWDTSYKTINTSLPILTSFYQWNWIELLGCNATQYRYFNPVFYFESCCSECVSCW